MQKDKLYINELEQQSAEKDASIEELEKEIVNFDDMHALVED